MKEMILDGYIVDKGVVSNLDFLLNTFSNSIMTVCISINS